MKAKKILTVDDDESIRQTLTQMLELEGFQAVWAKNGRVALDYMLATTDDDLPDLVLLDYMMPVMNGRDFFIEKEKTPRLANIPVVMMTANGNLVNVMDNVEAGGYMSKPMDYETVVRMVKHFLEDPQLQNPAAPTDSFYKDRYAGTGETHRDEYSDHF